MPTVTFLVPCYKLAHLLGDCVRSILSQTYTDFEILVLDDCSPDNTPEIARSFGDPRVRHVRNDPNLGHLRNYNKGIGMARGEFIWLVSADDCLKSHTILEQYVALFEGNPTVGFVFCPAIALVDGQQEGVIPWTRGGDSDFVVPGTTYLEALISGNQVATPSAMARKRCYQLSLFPLDMPFAGDWFLWCLFALHFDVAYLSEPMVLYRIHQASMTTSLTGTNTAAQLDEIRVLARLTDEATKVENRAVRLRCVSEIAKRAANMLVPPEATTQTAPELDDVLETIRANLGDDDLARRLGATIAEGAGDRLEWRGNSAGARIMYRRSLHLQTGASAVAKTTLSYLGPLGRVIRSAGGSGKRLGS